MDQFRKHTAFITISLIASAGTVLAADTKPKSNAGLPTLAEVRPVSAGTTGAPFFHDFKIGVEQGFGRNRNTNQPTELDQKSRQSMLSLQFGISDYAFAGVSGVYSHEDISSTNLAFAMPMAGDADVLGVDAMFGIRPLPFLSVGVLGGYGEGDASYTFTQFAIPPTPGDSTTRRFGGFLSGVYMTNGWTLTGTSTVIRLQSDQDYGPGNIPQYDSYHASLLLTQLGASYAATDRLDLSFGATWNHVLSQKVAAAQTGLDTNWFTLQAGVSYAVTSQIDIFAKAATWVGNEKSRFERFSLGASYSF